MQTPEQESLAHVRQMLTDRRQKYIHDNYIYDGTCNSWDAPDGLAEDAVIVMEAALKVLDDMILEEAS